MNKNKLFLMKFYLPKKVDVFLGMLIAAKNNGLPKIANEQRM